MSSRHSGAHMHLLQTCDFFGLLKDKEIDEKKDSVLETYKLLFRFSIEKLLNYLDDN